jgi:hypothetical protein
MLKFSTYNDLLENEGLKKKAEKSGISLGTLKKVYNRGMAAWKTGHRPGTTPQQWAHARVNSYITKGKGTYYGADSDLSGKGKKESVDEAKYDYFDSKDAAHAHAKKHGGKVYKNSGKGATMVKGKPANTHVVIKGKMFESSVDEAINAPILKTSKKHDPKHVKQAIGIASDSRYAKGNMTGAVKAMNKISPGLHKHPQVAAVLRQQNESKVNEISKNLARRYVNKAAIDMFHKGRDQGAADTIAKAGGQHPDQEYKGGPEFKGARRAGGIMRATRKLMKKEAMSDAEKKAHDAAIAAFKAKGGKVKKLKPGYAQGWTGKDDLGTGMKGMMSKDDTKGFGTSKKVGSMKR